MSFINGYCIIRNHEVITEHGRERSDTQTLEEFCDRLYGTLQPAYPKFYKMDPQSRLGFLATEVLLHQHSVNMYPSDAVAVVLSNSSGSQDTDQRFDASRKSMASPSLFVYTLPNIVMGEICIRHGIQGENAFFITPAFDATLLTAYVDEVLQQKHVCSCIAGWVNVLDQQHDVFLYLVEKEIRGLGIPHHSPELEKIYCQ